MTFTFQVMCRGIQYTTIIDDCDADLITNSSYKWGATKNPKDKNVYVKRNTFYGGKVGIELLHRLIYERMLGRKLSRREYVDHEDTDSLNNQRSNLRLATNSQNMANKPANSNNKLGVKGVSKEGNKYVAHIHVNGKSHHLGSFSTPELAHTAYLNAAKKHFGEFARGS